MAKTLVTAKSSAAVAVWLCSRLSGNRCGARLTSSPLAPNPSMASDTTMNDRW